MIHLVSTFGAKRHNLIPQFVGHYKKLGVENFHITLHTDIDLTAEEKQTILKNGAKILREVGVNKFHHLDCTFDAIKVRKHHDELQEKIAKTDWIIWADLDEFQEYWSNLNELIKNFDKRKINVVIGEFLDRISTNGELKEFNPNLDIFTQYPLGSEITGSILKGSTRKTTLAKANIRLCPGNHVPLSNQSIKYAFYYAIVHHFKWDASVKKRLSARRKNQWQNNFYWWKETDHFFNHLEENGKIKLDTIKVVDPAKFKKKYFSLINTILRKFNRQWYNFKLSTTATK